MALTPEQFFGKIGVKNGVFSQEQLDDCFRLQRQVFLETGEREALSYILMDKGYMTHEQSRDLLQEFKYSCMRKDDKEIAEIALELSKLTAEQVQSALSFQRKLFRGGVGIFQLGEILISRNYLTPDEVYELHCFLYLKRHPGAKLPAQPGSMPQPQGAESETHVRAVTDKEVEVIENRTSFKTCQACDYKNPGVATLCYNCGESLPDNADTLEEDALDESASASA